MRRALHSTARRAMPQHTMNRDVIITCAVTGSGDTAHIHPDLPKSPKEIAAACIEAGEAGAAIAHLHVREPGTGVPCRKLEYYEEVVGSAATLFFKFCTRDTRARSAAWKPPPCRNVSRCARGGA